MEIYARNIVNLPLDDIWYLSDVENVTLIMDDGSCVATGRSVIYSWFYWEYQRQIPELPLLCEHHVGMSYMTKSTHVEFLSTVLFSCHDISDGTIPLEVLAEIGQLITNYIYNEFIVRIEEYVTSNSILDYVEILEDPFIKEAVENTERSPEGIEHTLGEVKVYLTRHDKYPHNGLKATCETELGNWGQLLQAVVFRGYATDADNVFFRDPILSCYARGITKLHDNMIESRSGTKSLLSQRVPLEKTEYFNRRMQMSAETVGGMEPYKPGIIKIIVDRFSSIVDSSAKLAQKVWNIVRK